ncbi:MAG: choice-of-anchor J domain-containing protein, partial [Deltaproteobacteria bacterium]|nr:choice-of-anchor J domain-containing protein [Deltaproteobacteria bacterium]
GPGGASSATRPIASGNFLNWATMSRLTVAKKLLIGGKASPRSPSGATTVKTYAETTWGFAKINNNSTDPNLISTFSGNYKFTMSSSAALSVAVAGGVTITNTYPGYTDSVFNETAESGGVYSWSTSSYYSPANLWHIEDGSGNCSQAYTGTSSWYYGNAANPDKCQYKTKVSGADVSNYGALISPTIALPAGSPSLRLSFMNYYETEDSGDAYDRRRVYISTNGGASWTLLTQIYGSSMNTWQLKTIDLTAYAGMSIKLLFYFSTEDNTYNNYKGWYIDDVRIDDSTSSCYAVAKPAAWTINPTTQTACQAIDDTTNSSADSTYIRNASTQEPIVMNFNDLDVPVGTITQVQIVTWAKKAGTSTSSTRRLARVLRINGVNYCGPYGSATCSYSSLTTSYATGNTVWTTNPATGVAWTWNDLKHIGTNSIQGFGAQATTYSPTSANYMQIGRMYLLVTVTTPSGGPYNVIVDHDSTTKAEGIIDHLSSDARFGLGYYDTSFIDGGSVAEYVGFGASTNMITNISGKTATTGTPLGETLYEMTRYFRQDTPYYSASPAHFQTGLNYDPYYYRYTTLSGSTLSDQYVPCAKSFILFLTDGESTWDQNMPASIRGYSWGKGKNTDGTMTSSASGGLRLGGTANGTTSGSMTDYMIDVAYYARVNDARPGSCTTTPTSFNQCIPGIQNIVTYPVFLFGQGSTLLKDVAIYGGFDDINGDGYPGPDLKEYLRDSDGDGSITTADDPITYFEGNDGYELETSITNAIASIMKRSASGTAVSVLSTSQEGEGALYQAYFYPEKTMNDGTKRTWVGSCRGMFLDNSGNLREDSDANAELVLKNDKIFRMRFDTTTNKVMVDRYLDTTPEDGEADPAMTNPDGTPIDTVYDTIELDEIPAIWEAGAKLAKDTTTRNIYTWIDVDNDGVVDNGDFGGTVTSGEARSVTSSNATALKPYLRATSDAEAANIIGFVRGDYVSGYRDRCIPVAGATQETGCTEANARVWPLGDIVYSTPTTVGRTAEQHDQIYGVASYVNFRQAYNGRRNIVYVGANDGMLHAFNAGMYTAGDNAATSDVEHGKFEPNATTDWPGAELGTELWAFIPPDNLPHLKWLTQSDYTHVYYTDLKPKATDVRIFCDSDSTLNPPASPDCVNGQGSVSHPGGWGTILIVGMRLGGGAIDVAGDFDYNSGTADTTRTFRSAYYVLDVTNPEKKPRLLWRFTDANLGFTTSYPAIIHINGTPEKWFMVVGSGPDNNVPTGTRGYYGTSTQQGRIYVVNLLTGAIANTFTNLGINNAGAALDSYMFMGDATVVDGDLDYTDDIVYIGSSICTGTTAVCTGTTPTSTGGKVFRLNTNQDANPANWALSTLYNTGRPVFVGPSVAKDKLNNLWTFFGTGRFWGPDDKVNSDQQTFYGIKDACWKQNTTGTPCATTYTASDLLDSTNLAVCSSTATGGDAGKVYNTTTGTCGSGSVAYGAFSDLQAAVGRGWYLNLNDPASTPSERVLSRAAVIGGVVLVAGFTPDSDLCDMLGTSSFYALYYQTGTAYTKPIIGASGNTSLRSKDLGYGMPTTVSVSIGKDKTKGFTTTSLGAITEVEVGLVAPVRSGAAGWRENVGGGGTTGVEEIYKHIIK